MAVFDDYRTLAWDGRRLSNVDLFYGNTLPMAYEAQEAQGIWPTYGEEWQDIVALRLNFGSGDPRRYVNIHLYGYAADNPDQVLEIVKTDGSPLTPADV